MSSSFATPRIVFPVLHYLPELLKFMSIELVMFANHLVLCHSLLLLPTIFPSIRVFSNESDPSTRWPKNWSFSFSISPSNEYSGLISLRINWFDLLAVQGTLKSLLQHHNLKASILWPSAFFMVELSHLYITTGKTKAFYTIFVSKVMSLLFNMLSRFVITSLPKSKYFLISWLQSLYAVSWEPKKNKICHCFCFPPFCLPWSDLRCHDLSFWNVRFQTSFFTLLLLPYQEAL